MIYQYVGLSLSFCVRDILKGNVPIENVQFIVPGFDWVKASMIASPHYYTTYWKDWSQYEVDEILEQVKFVNRVGGMSANIAHGTWIKAIDFTWTRYHDPDYRIRTKYLI